VKERHGRTSKQTAADEVIRDHDAIAYGQKRGQGQWLNHLGR
jgi:hypothetical protein